MRSCVVIVLGLLFTLPVTSYGQPKFETQVHYSAPAGDLADIAGGGIGNVSAGISFPFNAAGYVNIVIKGGYNEYGGLKGTGLLSTFEFKARGIPFLGGVRVYDETHRFFFEAALGTEVKMGHLSFGAFEEEETKVALLGSAGAGVFFWRGLGFAASYNISQDSWQYGNIGLVFRFGG